MKQVGVNWNLLLALRFIPTGFLQEIHELVETKDAINMIQDHEEYQRHFIADPFF